MLIYSTATRNGYQPMPDMTPMVIVVDDDVSTREGLEALLEAAGWPVKSFATATAFLSWEAPSVASCLILDVGLPDLNGLDLQTLIAGDRPQMPIIFITGAGDIPTTVRAMKAGATEFLTKPLSDDILLPAVERAIALSQAVVEEKAGSQALQERYDALSPRERQVMALVVSGLLNKQAGWELGISEITVKAHRGRVMEKMQAKSFAALVKMSERLGLDAASRH